MSAFDQQFDIFKGIAITVNTEWQVYRDFRSPECISTFATTGRGFYYLVEEVLLKSVIVGLGGIFDPAQTFGHANLSAIYIMEQPEVRPFKVNLDAIFDPIDKIWRDGAKKWRNKLLAHLSLDVLTQKADYPDFVIGEIETMTNGIWDIIREINGQLYGADLSKTVSIQEGLPNVLRYLKLGRAAQSEGLASKLLG